MNFKGKAKRIEDMDIPRIASEIGCGEDEVHAFMDVESAGSGFDSEGRPKMLFEPHVFYRNLKAPKRNTAVARGLAYATWKSGNYPKDSYPRLIEALQIDKEAALKSASWGLGQILGENHLAAGYPTAEAMVLAFMEDEEAHLQAMINFLKAKSLDDDLREHRWAALARGYNGAGYAKNKYHIKLEAAYKKWAKIPNTPWKKEGSVEGVVVAGGTVAVAAASYGADLWLVALGVVGVAVLAGLVYYIIKEK